MAKSLIDQLYDLKNSEALKNLYETDAGTRSSAVWRSAGWRPGPGFSQLRDQFCQPGGRPARRHPKRA